MLKKDVKVGKTYEVRLYGNFVKVKLVSESRLGGWLAINLNTNRNIRIKSAAKLRREVTSDD